MSPDNDLDEPLLRIVCAAVHKKNSAFTVPGIRHYDDDMMVLIYHLFVPFKKEDYIDGFLTNKGKFLSRKQAWVVADKARQIRSRIGQVFGELHSEDLY